MLDLIRTLPLALLLVLAGPALSQDADPDAEPEVTPDPLALNMGEEPAEENRPGSIYVRSEHGDWEIRCFRAAEGQQDPCQMYQLLTDGSGNAVSEINVFPLTSANSDAAAGATIVTPLETLLTAQLSMQVDSAAAKRYPFSWCSEIGCFARLGFSNEDVAALKRGNVASLVIVPVAAPDQRVTLTVSLTGFTAAFDEASELLSAQ